MRQRQFVIKMIVISHEKLKYCLVVRDDNDMFLITILDMKNNPLEDNNFVCFSNDNNFLF